MALNDFLDKVKNKCGGRGMPSHLLKLRMIFEK